MSDLNIYADQTAIDALTPITGDVVLRASDNAVLLYNGSAWKEFQPDAGPFSNQYSVNLDGSNDYVALASGLESTINSASALTFSAWFNINKYGSAIVSSGTSVTNGIWFLAYNSSTFFFSARNGGSESISVNPSGSFTLNNWHHVCGVLDGANSKVYFDGSEAGSGTLPALGSTAGSNPSIGSYQRNSFFTGGLIDEVSIFNSALSASDVAALRDTTGSNPVPADISSLSPVGWWRMGDNDGGTGSTITDQGSGGSGGNDGTLMNGADIYSGTLDPNPDGAGPDFSSSVPS